MSTQTNMEPGFLERLGDKFNSFTEGVMNLITRIMGGNPSERTVKSLGYYRPKGSVEHAVIPGSVLGRVNDLEPRMKELSDDELKALSDEFRGRIRNGESLDGLLPEAFAACREAARRSKNMRHYDVQIVGGAVLHHGNIAEMVTGEGKTLVATLPAYLNSLEVDRSGQSRGVHIVTVNQYLA